MRRISALGAITVVVSTALLLSACGSSPSSSSSSTRSSSTPKQLVAAAYKAALGANSVHVVGTVTTSKQGQAIDLVLTKSGEASGSIDLNGDKVDLVAAKNDDYLRANASFWQNRGGAPASIAKRIGSHWLEVPPNTASALTSDLSVKAIFGDLDKNLGTLTKVPSKMVDGQKALGVHSSKGGTLYIAASGSAWPLQLVGTVKSQSANLLFSKWDSAKVAPAPKGAISIESLES